MAGRDAIDSDLANARKRKRLLNTASTRYDRDNSESGVSYRAHVNNSAKLTRGKESSLFVADEDGRGGDVMVSIYSIFGRQWDRNELTDWKIVDRSPPEAIETGSPDLLCCLCGEEKPSKSFTSQFPEPVCTDCEPLNDLS